MLDKKTLSICKKKLLKMKKQYLEVLRRPMKFSRMTGEVIDVANNVNQAYQSSFFRKRMSDLLPQINQALHRIEFGGYGVCAETGELIERNRLIAIPWTTTSLKAHEQRQSLPRNRRH